MIQLFPYALEKFNNYFSAPYLQAKKFILDENLEENEDRQINNGRQIYKGYSIQIPGNLIYIQTTVH